MQVDANGIVVWLDSDTGVFEASLTSEAGEQDGVSYVTLSVVAEQVSQLPDLKLCWKLPSVDFHHKWNSECMQNRALDVGNFTANYVTSRANRQAPVYSLYNLDGTNTCTFALSDAVHDTRLGGTYASGMSYNCSAVISGGKMDPVKAYAVTLRFDVRRIPYYQSLRDVTQWWQAMPQYRPCHVPDAARRPLFSSWYIYEMAVDPEDLEKQCALAKASGIDVAILDDGWQTDQVGTGYRSNGDWEVCPAKIPDFAAHVKRIQQMGLKYLVWFSVPFVGMDSKAYKTMKRYLMPGKEGAQWFGFDLRFPEAREYLATTYERFVGEYGIDGLKLDFIGSIGGRPEDETASQPGHDTASIGVAVCKLLDDVTARLRALNPDILIEFRQGYIGPAMRKYGNMFRAVDCPNSVGDNRVRTLDIRLLCGDTAVHADPITWHDDDPPESAAMQLVHTLFSAPQISKRVSELTDVHAKMLKSYLSFWRTYRDVLMEGDLAPLYPHLLYPMVRATTETTWLVAFYANMPFVCGSDAPEEIVLVNGTYQRELIIDAADDVGRFTFKTVDCLGNTVQEGSVSLVSGLSKFAVPVAGYAILRRDAGC